MRAAMSGIMESNYIRTARAKGVPNRWVVLKHGLRNALLPVLTSFMVDLGQLLGGVTVIEAVFNYRGIGNMMFEAIQVTRLSAAARWISTIYDYHFGSQHHHRIDISTSGPCLRRTA